jgi:hypothetical protein
MARIGYPDDSNPEVAALHTKPFIEHWHYWKKNDKARRRSTCSYPLIDEQPTNCKPIARHMTRFSIRMPFNVLSSSPACVIELSP